MNKIAVFALSRSGHNAIIRWICEQLEENTIHYYRCEEDLENSAYRPIEYKKSKDNTFHNYIYGLDNFDLNGFKHIFKNKFNKILIINRDPYNWIASNLKLLDYRSRLVFLSLKFTPTKESKKFQQRKWFGYTMARLEMYKQYIKQSLGDINLMNESFIDISYNEWFISKDYRKKIANKLKLDFTDNGLNTVEGYPFGSSFDKFKFNGHATEMDVLNRWQNYRKNKLFLNYLSEEIKELSRRYFNFNPL